MICKGDRVAVVSGSGPESRDKGKIGVVQVVRKETREVIVGGLNKVCLFSLFVVLCFKVWGGNG